MLNIAFRLLLTFNATSLLIIIFLVQKKYTLNSITEHTFLAQALNQLPNSFSYFVYLITPIISTGLSIFLIEKLGQDSFKKGEISSIEYANNSFLPSYLGYFFVALSITDYGTLFFVYAILFAFTFLSQALYFNPLFLVFGYKFYNITTNDGVTLFLISRHNYKTPNEVDIPIAFRINDYTFIERT